MYSYLNERLAYQRQQERRPATRTASLRIAMRARQREAKRLGA